jgi:cation transport regulator ChaC
MQQLQSRQLAVAANEVRRFNSGDLLLAGYGSLPNAPEAGTTFLAPVLIADYDKDLCVEVTVCRGEPTRPGLVAGLLPRPGAMAMGALSRVEPGAAEEVLQRLDARELDAKAYEARVVRAISADGSIRHALAFTAAVTHPQCRVLDVPVAAAMVAGATGSCGTNRDYLELVVDFERETFGRITPKLAAIARLVDQMPRSGRILTKSVAIAA